MSADQRKALEAELMKVKAQEEEIEKELRQYFSALAGGRSLQSKGLSFESADLSNNIQKIEGFAPFYETTEMSSQKLALQIDECHSLSDRLSLMVRRLDVMQIRAQKALACTEDVINLKESKSKMLQAIESSDLPSAVNFIRQTHDIGMESIEASDESSSFAEIEKEVKRLVQQKFFDAIAASDVVLVMSLCPLLQTLGLEADARDSFLDFMEKTVFIAVSADASSVDDATDPATAYAQSLSNIFNSSYAILQQYLTMVIQGMENSLGDVHFIRKLHARSEQEAGLVLKRYMKYRKIKDVINYTQNPQGKQNAVTAADMHSILDELALLIQYCCMYSKYLKQLCLGAESRPRKNMTEKFLVISGSPTTFDQMVEELISRYYMEGEKWLMKKGIQSAFEAKSEFEISGLDECFFVLQRCSHRAIASNNANGACSILHTISDLLVADLLKQLTTLLNTAISKISSAVQEHTTKLLKVQGDTSSDASNSTASISIVLKGIGLKGDERENDTASSGQLVDPYGLSSFIEVFNTVEICCKYTERLRRDVAQAGESVFGSLSNIQQKKVALDVDNEKMKLCLEDFESVKAAFSQVLRTGSEQLVSQLQNSVKEVISFTLGRTGLLGGIKLDLDDELFDLQPAVSVLPKALVNPLESILDICTNAMSESNKDVTVGLLANTCSEKLEQFIYQSSFGYAGAMKLDECVRALNSMFVRYSTIPIRGKFSRLREILQVLTSDVSGGINSVSVDTFSHLTAHEVQAFIALRIDAPPE